MDSQVEPSKKKRKKTRPDTKVIRGSIIAIIVLSGLVLALYGLQISSEKKGYSMFFGNNETFNFYRDERLTAVISNNEDGSNSLSLYGLNPAAPSQIFASLFSDNGRDTIGFQDILFDNLRVADISGLNNSPTITQVSIDKIDLGVYHGWFYIIGQENYFIPVTISTAPMIIESIFIILIGAATAIAVMELEKRSSKKTYEERKQRLLSEFNEVDDNISSFNAQRDRRSAEAAFEKRAQIIGDLQLVDAKVRILENRYNGLPAQIKQAALDLIPGFFAVLLVVIAFLNNSYVTNIVELNPEDVMILFALGAGISSLKGIFDRPKTPK